MMNIYLGARVEVANRFYTVKNLSNVYNRRYNDTHVFNVNTDGKISAEKTHDMLIARGEKRSGDKSGLVNFSVGINMGNDKSNALRIAQIINVLGNDRLIKERVKTFIDGKSMLNSIPELKLLSEAFKNLDSMMPGFIVAGWYYAPEIIER